MTPPAVTILVYYQAWTLALTATCIYIYNEQLCHSFHQCMLKEEETVSNMSEIHFILTQLISQEDFIEFICH